MPTEDELNRIVNGPDRFDAMPRLLQLWLAPVEPMFPVINDTRSKPIGQLTVPELMAWGVTVGYIAASMALAQLLVFNLLRVAVQGR